MTTPLPAGFGITWDDDTKRLDDSCVFGGSPARVVRLSEAGRRAYDDLRAGVVATRSAGVLARRLTDAGLAHPIPPDTQRALDVTVVVPVHDRPAHLDRCLSTVAGRYPVVVVDDASRDAAAVEAVCARHGATLVRREVNGGPGAARDSGLAIVRSEFVAFLDSDCIPPADWIDRLAPHGTDPLVGAVAPRITGAAPDTYAGRYTRANSSLDLGARAARVAPGTRVSYVPTAALLVRRAALTDVTRGGRVFDPGMRVGEDVDLIWRLHEAGWRIRYQPDVQVEHSEPTTWRGLLRRRHQYGTSAAPLAVRHPDAMTPLVLHPLPTIAVAAALARKPAISAAAVMASAVLLRRKLTRAGVPTAGTERAVATAAWQTGLGLSRYVTQFAAPAAVAVAVTSRRSPGRGIAALALLAASPIADWLRRRPDLDPIRYVAAHLADDLAYGTGVWAGCLRTGNYRAVRPTITKGTLT